MISRSSSFLQIALVAAVVSNIGLAFRSIYVERQLTARIQSADSLATALSVDKRAAAAERTALVRALAEMPPFRPFLSGVLTSDTTVRVTYDVADGVYYLISPTCPACDINYPFLDSLARKSRLRVVAISRDASPSDLSRYVRERAVSLPFLASPSGYVDHITPRWGTPLSVIVLDGKLHSIVPGRLDETVQQDLFGLAARPNIPIGRD